MRVPIMISDLLCCILRPRVFAAAHATPRLSCAPAQIKYLAFQR